MKTSRNIFEHSVLNDVRVLTPKGALCACQLNQLPINMLIDVATELAETLSKTQVSLMSFVDASSEQDESIELKFNLVKSIIQNKQDFVKLQNESAVRKTKIDEFDRLITAKENAAKDQLSIEELHAMRAQLIK